LTIRPETPEKSKADSAGIHPAWIDTATAMQ